MFYLIYRLTFIERPHNEYYIINKKIFVLLIARKRTIQVCLKYSLSFSILLQLLTVLQHKTGILTLFHRNSYREGLSLQYNHLTNSLYPHRLEKRKRRLVLSSCRWSNRKQQCRSGNRQAA